MRAAELCAGLAAAARVRREALLALAGSVAAGPEVRVVEGPAPGVVTLRLTTVAGELCLADAVVTTAAVEVEGRPGWACVLGWDDRGALAAALCAASGDAAATALAESAVAAERGSAEAAAAEVATTRVTAG